MIVYGLPTCSDTTRALKSLRAAGHDATLRDIRADPLTEAERAALLHEFGDRLIDRKSVVWRGLSAWIREAEAEEQLVHSPAVMARPVIADGARMTLGWDEEVAAIWGA
ncbi:MAG: hypothetical protein GW886_00475 [Rhodobacterales bacterium]|nr:hypothetical protein [Rhodobacterales bacterium]